ncbi:MAG: hypothetical protein LBE84_02545 [Planctomycetota bacterium]|jgi:hypothetical protein|nr:hypothetical protein [Planctomycetota bacterium]
MHVCAKAMPVFWLLSIFVAAGGEGIMPLRPGTPNPGWQRATSIDAKPGSASDGGGLRKNVVRLKIPFASSLHGDSRVHLVKAGEGPDGLLDFSLLRPDAVLAEPAAIPAIPGLITPEELALDRLGAGNPDVKIFEESNVWPDPFPETAGNGFPDSGDPAWPDFPSPALPRQNRFDDNNTGAAFISPPDWHGPSSVPARPLPVIQTGSLRPPTPPVEATGSLRPPGFPCPASPAKSAEDRQMDISSALSFAHSDPAPKAEAAKRSDNGGVPAMSQAEYLRLKNAYDPSQFSSPVEPVRWPDPLPGPAKPWETTVPLPTSDEFRRPTGTGRENSGQKPYGGTSSRRRKSAGITPVRELRNALQPLRRAN